MKANQRDEKCSELVELYKGTCGLGSRSEGLNLRTLDAGKF